MEFVGAHLSCKNVPIRRLYNLPGCSVGDWSIVLCLRGSLFRQFVCSVISWNIPNVPESIGWMFLRHSGCAACWQSLVGMFVTIGCLWCCICAMAWIADSESVSTTMLFMHGGLGLSVSGDGL